MILLRLPEAVEWLNLFSLNRSMKTLFKSLETNILICEMGMTETIEIAKELTVKILITDTINRQI